MAVRWPAKRGDISAGGSASALADLSDVTSAGTMAGYVLVADGSAYVGRALVEADISDLGTYTQAAVDENITGFWDFQDGAQFSATGSGGTQWQIKAEDTYGTLLIEPEAVGGGGNAWGIHVHGVGYVGYGGGSSTLATPGVPTHGDTLNNYTSFLLGHPDDYDYIADIGFFGDTLFQFGTYPVDGNFGFYVTDGTPANWIYPFYVETRNQDTWFLSYTVNIGQTTGGVWDNAGSVSTPTKYASLSEDGTDFNFALTSLTDLNFTGMTAVNVPALASSGAVTGSNLNVSNWDTAYGWGDHSSLYPTIQAKNSSTVNGKTANYTLVAGDEGETIRMTGSTAAQTITIPANASVAFPVGTLICIQNDASVSWSLAITSDTLTWAEDNTTGTRTLAAGATAVIQKVASTNWKVAGSSLVT